MPHSCRSLVTTVLRELGHEVPSDDELDRLLAEATNRLKREQGLSDSFDLRLVSLKIDDA